MMMNTYKIVNGLNGKFHVTRGPREDFELFCGYDFMGSVNWNKSWNEAEAFDTIEDAKQIIKDLEAAEDEQPDPMIEKFQRILDSAVYDRDSFGARWTKLTEEGGSELDCHRAYTRYLQAQGYLEGMTTAIFATGYNILPTVDSTKMIVTK